MSYNAADLRDFVATDNYGEAAAAKQKVVKNAQGQAKRKL
jgi:hypothetical protein